MARTRGAAAMPRSLLLAALRASYRHCLLRERPRLSRLPGRVASPRRPPLAARSASGPYHSAAASGPYHSAAASGPYRNGRAARCPSGSRQARPLPLVVSMSHVSPPPGLGSHVSGPRAGSRFASGGSSARHSNSLIFSKTKIMRLSQLTSHRARVILPLSTSLRGKAHADTKKETTILWP